MYIPHVSNKLSNFLSTLFMLVVVAVTLQACSIEPHSPSLEQPAVMHGETFKQGSELLRVDDNDSNFATKASSYMKRVNKNLSDDDARTYASYIRNASEEYDVDKHLLLAMIRVESRFNRTAVSPDGAKGLTQVVPRYHKDTIARVQKQHYAGSLFHPGVSIYVGASVLHGYIKQGGSTTAGLLMYNGSQADPRKRYAKLVLAEYRKVKAL